MKLYSLRQNTDIWCYVSLGKHKILISIVHLIMTRNLLNWEDKMHFSSSAQKHFWSCIVNVKIKLHLTRMQNLTNLQKVFNTETSVINSFRLVTAVLEVITLFYIYIGNQVHRTTFLALIWLSSSDYVASS